MNEVTLSPEEKAVFAEIWNCEHLPKWPKKSLRQRLSERNLAISTYVCSTVMNVFTEDNLKQSSQSRETTGSSDKTKAFCFVGFAIAGAMVAMNNPNPLEAVSDLVVHKLS